MKNSAKILQMSECRKICEILPNLKKVQLDSLVDFEKCQNAYFFAKIGADTAENEQHFAEILPKTGNYPTGPLGPGARAAGLLVVAALVLARRRRGGRVAETWAENKEAICCTNIISNYYYASRLYNSHQCASIC